MDTVFDLILQTDSAHFVEWLAQAREQNELPLHADLTGVGQVWLGASARGGGAGWLIWDGNLFTFVAGHANPTSKSIGELMRLDIRETGPSRLQVVCKEADLSTAQAQGLVTASECASILPEVSAYAQRVQAEVRRVFAVIDAAGSETRPPTVNYFVSGDLVEGDKTETNAGGDVIGRDKITSGPPRPDVGDQAPPPAPVAAQPAPAIKYPYTGFRQSFRDIVSPKIYARTGGVLNLVFGSLADIRETTVVIPVSQSFDFGQRGPRSVLASFGNLRVGDNGFFETLDKLWPSDERPQAAGVAEAKYIGLPLNSQQLDGVIFVVTTRDLSRSPQHYGRYVDTPVEGLDYVLDQLLELANDQAIPSLALPLLGTGYANVAASLNHPELKLLLQQIVLALTIHKLEGQFSLPTSVLKRGIVVVYSGSPQSPEENQIWEFTLKLLTQVPGQRAEQIEALMHEYWEKRRAITAGH